MKQEAEHYALSDKDKRLAIVFKQQVTVYSLDRSDDDKDIVILGRNTINLEFPVC